MKCIRKLLFVFFFFEPLIDSHITRNIHNESILRPIL